jgi:hypothetical protein
MRSPLRKPYTVPPSDEKATKFQELIGIESTAGDIASDVPPQLFNTTVYVSGNSTLFPVH